MSRLSKFTGNLRNLWLVGFIVLLAGCSGSGTDPESPPSTTDAPTIPAPLDTTTTTTTDTTTTSPVDAADAAVAVVVSALDAKNNFDLDGWLMAFEGGRRSYPIFADEILMNANQHWEIVEPCQVTGETASGETIVECLIQDVNIFWGVGGISDTKTQTFTVNTDGLLTSTNSFSSDRRDAFNRAFHQWLSDTYPDVYSEMNPGFISSNGPGFDTQNPAHMLVAVDHVEEFVAQSDKYPLDPSDQ
jgi:hypothetical protein